MTSFDATDEPDAATKDAIHAILLAYNREHFETLDEREFAITARDDDGTVIGGIYGTTFGQWLEIAVLAVAPGHRRQGLGSGLLRQAERLGTDRGCRHALLNTFGFQGRDFYPRYGYRQIGAIEGYPLRGTMHWFVKDLA